MSLGFEKSNAVGDGMLIRAATMVGLAWLPLALLMLAAYAGDVGEVAVAKSNLEGAGTGWAMGGAWPNLKGVGGEAGEEGEVDEPKTNWGGLVEDVEGVAGCFC